MLMRLIRGAVSAMVGISLLVASAQPAMAQMDPTGSPRAAGPSVGSYTTLGDLAGVQQPAMPNMPTHVLFDEAYEQGQRPMAVRKERIGLDTPALTINDSVTLFGREATLRVAAENSRLCNMGFQYMDVIVKLDFGFAKSAIAYQQLLEIFNALPGKIKKGSRIMMISQAAATGALCLLSAGLYCIAAIFSGIGNLFTNQASKKLQLANIKLSIQNILVTQLNIDSNRLTLRLDAFWLDLVVPYCMKIFPGMGANTAGSFSAALAPLPANDNEQLSQAANDNQRPYYYEPPARRRARQ